MSRLITPKNKNLDGMMSNMQRVFDVCQTPGPKKAAEIRRPVDRQVGCQTATKGQPSQCKQIRAAIDLTNYQHAKRKQREAIHAVIVFDVTRPAEPAGAFDLAPTTANALWPPPPVSAVLPSSVDRPSPPRNHLQLDM
jgi:hypothetical protein